MTLWSRVWGIAALVVATLALWHMFDLASYGFDFTDESFYLNWIRNPWLYDSSVTQFGFVYHPIYEALRGDIALLRSANLALTVALGIGLGLAIQLPPEPFTFRDVLTALTAAVPTGFVAALLYSSWLITPSYNALNLQGLLVAGIAFVLIGRHSPKTPTPFPCWGAYALLGLGGWLVFMAKPPSAVVLGTMSVVYLASIRRLSVMGAAAACGGALAPTLVSAISIDGSVSRFVARLWDGVVISSQLDNRYSTGGMLRVDSIDLTWVQWTTLAGTAVLTSAVIVLAAVRRRWANAVVTLLLALVVGLCTQVLMVRPPLVSVEWAWSGVLLLGFPIGVSVGLLILGLCGRRSLPKEGHIQLSIALAALPYVYAFGSNVNQWKQAGNAAVFWVGASLVLIGAFNRESKQGALGQAAVLIPFSLTAALIGFGLEYPYRQSQALRLNDQIVEVGRSGARLVLSADSARYVRELQAAAKAAGLVAGVPLIDLTGHYPGAPAVLGSLAVGAPWIIGGYPGSVAVASTVLNQIPCKTLTASWVLVEADGPRAIVQDVLGTELRYEVGASFDSPVGSYPVHFHQALLRPVHDQAEAVALCTAARDQGKAWPTPP